MAKIQDYLQKTKDYIKKNKTSLLIIANVLLLLFIVGAIYLYNRTKTQKNVIPTHNNVVSKATNNSEDQDSGVKDITDPAVSNNQTEKRDQTETKVTPKETPPVQTVQAETTKTQKILAISYNPADTDGNIVEKYFSSILNTKTLTQFEDEIFADAATSITKASHNTYKYTIAGKLKISTFFSNSDGSVLSVADYSKCIGGSTQTDLAYCETFKQKFDYQKFVVDNKICKKAQDLGANEIWVLSPPYIGAYESYMITNANGYFVNGPVVVSNTCIKPYVVINGTYDRPDLFLHSYGHMIESTFEYMTSQWDSGEQNKHWRKFSRFGDYSPKTYYPRCGNTHFPHNTTSGYDYSNTTTSRNNCADWSNFPSYTGSYTNGNCSLWGCNDHDWQVFWFSGIPYHIGSSEIKSWDGSTITTPRNWWKFITTPSYTIGYVE